MDQDPPFQGPYPDRSGYGHPVVNPARCAVYAEERPMTLTFELSRTEYVIPAGESVEVEFDLWVSKLLPSLIHHEDGITFIGAGAHPTVWKKGQLMPVSLPVAHPVRTARRLPALIAKTAATRDGPETVRPQVRGDDGTTSMSLRSRVRAARPSVRLTTRGAYGLSDALANPWRMNS